VQYCFNGDALLRTFFGAESASYASFALPHTLRASAPLSFEEHLMIYVAVDRDEVDEIARTGFDAHSAGGAFVINQSLSCHWDPKEIASKGQAFETVVQPHAAPWRRSLVRRRYSQPLCRNPLLRKNISIWYCSAAA